MVSFSNTEIAFQYCDKYKLIKAYWLFRLMRYGTLVKAAKFFINTAIKLHIPVSWILKPTIFKHFCGGESLAEASSTIKILNKYHVKTILDYSVEGKDTLECYENSLKETIATIDFAAKNPDVPFAVFKPSAFGSRNILEKASKKDELNNEEKSELDQFKKRIEELCKRAFDCGIPIMIDAEHSYYQIIIDEVCDEMMQKFNKSRAIVFNTLQMYRSDRLEFLKRAYEKAVRENYFLGIKFVRGAYMEKERERAQKYNYPSPIYPDKQATDNAYNESLRFSISHIDRISIFNGTHNDYSCLLLTELMEEAKITINDNRIWFSQLYGMSDNISFNLAHNGFNVAKYVPFGPVNHVIPYLLRRAEENTSVKGQTSREMAMIEKEVKRRKMAKKG
jgi:proline dehydrogenase